MTDQEQGEKDRLAQLYERHLAWVRATYPEEYERYLAAIEEVRLTGQNPYDQADRELDDLAEALRSAPVHSPAPKP
jgi:hypothetical protein